MCRSGFTYDKSDVENDAKKESNSLFEEKQHVVLKKTTRRLKENDTSVVEEGGEGDFEEVVADEKASRSGDFEDSSFSPKV